MDRLGPFGGYDVQPAGDNNVYKRNTGTRVHLPNESTEDFVGFCEDLMQAAGEFLEKKPRHQLEEIKKLSGLIAMFEKIAPKRKK